MGLSGPSAMSQEERVVDGCSGLAINVVAHTECGRDPARLSCVPRLCHCPVGSASGKGVLKHHLLDTLSKRGLFHRAAVASAAACAAAAVSAAFATAFAVFVFSFSL